MKHTRLSKIQTGVVHLFFTAVVLVGAAAFPLSAYSQAYQPLSDAQACDSKKDPNSESCQRARQERETREQAEKDRKNDRIQARKDRERDEQERLAEKKRALEDRLEARHEKQKQRCDDAIEKWKEANSKYKSLCKGADANACRQKANDCSGNEYQQGGAQQAHAAFMYEQNNYIAKKEFQNTCDAMKNATCPELNAGTAETYKDEEKKLTDDRVNIKKDIEKLTEEQNEFRKNLVDENEKFKDDLFEGDKGFKERVQAIMEALPRASQELDGKLKGQFLEVRKNFDDMDKAYIVMRAKSRELAEDVNRVKNAREVTCKQSAESAYAKVFAELEQRRAAEKAAAKGKKINWGSALQLAGKAKKQKKLTNERLKMAYGNFYTQCLQGQGVGAEAEAKIKEMKSKQKTAEAGLKDEELRIEKLRAQMKDDLQELAKSVEKNKEDLSQEAQQKMNRITQEYNDYNKRNQEKYALKQEQAKQDSEQLMRRVGFALQKQTENERDIQMAHSRYLCTKAFGGEIKDSVAESRLQKIEDSVGAIEDVTSACMTLPQACTQQPQGPMDDLIGTSQRAVTGFQNSCESIAAKGMPEFNYSVDTFDDNLNTAIRGIGSRSDDDDADSELDTGRRRSPSSSAR